MVNGQRSARGGRRTLFLATLIAVLIVLLNIAIGGKISALVRDIVSPISSAGGRFGAMITQNGYFTSRSQLEAQIAALQAELQQDQLQAAAFSVVQQENNSLSALEHLPQSSPGLAAPVTSSVISSPYGTFSVGAGSADGIQSGALVLISGGFVVGKITQVQAHQSLVSEIFAPGMETPVTIDGSATVVTGNGAEGVAEVPHGVTVSQGDPVIAPDFGGKPIGTVEHVDANPANAQEAIYIALPVSISSVSFVYITP